MANKYLCVDCLYERVPINRAKWCIKEQQRITCLQCGEVAAKRESKRKESMVQIPYSKGAYQYIYNPADLIGTNPKRTV
jgi:hypothetical protein